MDKSPFPLVVAQTLRRRLPTRLQDQVWLGWLSDWLASPTGRSLAQMASPLSAGDADPAPLPLGARQKATGLTGDGQTGGDGHICSAPLPAPPLPVPDAMPVPSLRDLPGPDARPVPSLRDLPGLGGTRLVIGVCPMGYDPHRPMPAKLLIASSRVGQWERRPELAAAVRSLMVHLEGSPEELVSGQEMTCRDLTYHVAHLFGRRGWEWIPPRSARWTTWARRLHALISENPPTAQWGYLYLSPNLPVPWYPRSEPEAANGSVPRSGIADRPVPQVGLDEGGAAWPLADQLAFASAQRVYALSVRPGGHTWSLASAALQGGQSARRVHVFVPGALPEASRAVIQERQHARRLMQQGAVGWYLVPPDQPEPTPAAAPPPCMSKQNAPSWLGTVSQLQPGEASDYLAHHTRRVAGAFPEEQEADYWWRWLIFDTSGSTPLDVLLRILCQRRLRAGGRLIPGQVPAVCFSARCPLQSAAQRTFRPHLRRWDYEPYGVAIDHDWLLAAGARAVEYLEGAEPATPFQQIRYSGTPPDQRTDWSQEREFRLLGDLDLRRVPPGRLFWFVPTREEAQRVATFTHQPVKYLNSPGRPESRVVV